MTLLFFSYIDDLSLLSILIFILRDLYIIRNFLIFIRNLLFLILVIFTFNFRMNYRFKLIEILILYIIFYLFFCLNTIQLLNIRILFVSIFHLIFIAHIGHVWHPHIYVSRLGTYLGLMRRCLPYIFYYDNIFIIITLPWFRNIDAIYLAFWYSLCHRSDFSIYL